MQRQITAIAVDDQRIAGHFRGLCGQRHAVHCDARQRPDALEIVDRGALVYDRYGRSRRFGLLAAQRHCHAALGNDEHAVLQRNAHAVRHEHAVLHDAMEAVHVAVHVHFSRAVRADGEGHFHAHVGQRIGCTFYLHAHAVPYAQIFIGDGGILRFGGIFGRCGGLGRGFVGGFGDRFRFGRRFGRVGRDCRSSLNARVQLQLRQQRGHIRQSGQRVGAGFGDDGHFHR